MLRPWWRLCGATLCPCRNMYASIASIVLIVGMKPFSSCPLYPPLPYFALPWGPGPCPGPFGCFSVFPIPLLPFLNPTPHPHLNVLRTVIPMATPTTSVGVYIAECQRVLESMRADGIKYEVSRRVDRASTGSRPRGRGTPLRCA